MDKEHEKINAQESHMHHVLDMFKHYDYLRADPDSEFIELTTHGKNALVVLKMIKNKQVRNGNYSL